MLGNVSFNSHTSRATETYEENQLRVIYKENTYSEILLILLMCVYVWNGERWELETIEYSKQGYDVIW